MQLLPKQGRGAVAPPLFLLNGGNMLVKDTKDIFNHPAGRGCESPLVEFSYTREFNLPLPEVSLPIWRIFPKGAQNVTVAYLAGWLNDTGANYYPYVKHYDSCRYDWPDMAAWMGRTKGLTCCCGSSEPLVVGTDLCLLCWVTENSFRGL